MARDEEFRRFLQKFGSRIKGLRTSRGMTKAQLAESMRMMLEEERRALTSESGAAADFDRWIQRIDPLVMDAVERGREGDIDLVLLFGLARALGLGYRSAAELFTG